MFVKLECNIETISAQEKCTVTEAVERRTERKSADVSLGGAVSSTFGNGKSVQSGSGGYR